MMLKIIENRPTLRLTKKKKNSSNICSTQIPRFLKVALLFPCFGVETGRSLANMMPRWSTNGPAAPDGPLGCQKGPLPNLHMIKNHDKHGYIRLLAMEFIMDILYPYRKSVDSWLYQAINLLAIPSGKHKKANWKMAIDIVELPIENGDFPELC